ncbi:MAG: hypothetical protein AB1542_20495 [Pseudomonadota bacterium]|jgi:hypothetical protein|uniref:hypothetical protein n=1 Tax=Caulobacter sp. CCH9-E1 TaxID=1768768 RepID=UPI00083663FF|nr:hypothetical protein [Caulobacter sp. CCH9-E1]
MFQPELLWGVGTVLLLLALIYGVIQYRTRNRANDPVSEKAAKTLYDDPDGYDAKREALKDEVEPAHEPRP